MVQAVPAAGKSRMDGVLSTLAWMITSSMLIMLNKQLYVMGFPYPCMVTGLGQLASCFGGYAMARFQLMPIRKPPTLRFFATRLLPIVVCTTATMFTGNWCYLFLSVAFIQILKALTPAVTLGLCAVCGLERITAPLVLSIALICGGTIGSVWIESGTGSFRWLGLLSFMLSALTEAARVVGAELVMGEDRYNSAEVLVYIGGPTAGMLILSSLLWEGPSIADKGLQILLHNPAPLAYASVMSFLVNLTSFFAISTTSSLSFKVAGCLKNVLVVCWGMLQYKESVTPTQLLGYAVSATGFLLYSNYKLAQQRLPGDQPPGDQRQEKHPHLTTIISSRSSLSVTSLKARPSKD